MKIGKPTKWSADAGRRNSRLAAWCGAICLLVGCLSPLFADGPAAPVIRAQPPAGTAPTGASVMEQLARPAGPGRTGPRSFSRTRFEAGHIAWVVIGTFGT